MVTNLPSGQVFIVLKCRKVKLGYRGHLNFRSVVVNVHSFFFYKVTNFRGKSTKFRFTGNKTVKVDFDTVRMIL